MNDFQFLQLRAVREAATVRRTHIIPHHGIYQIGQHSFGALSLLLLLYPEPGPSLNLIKAVQWHDVAERWMGDMPSPGKRMNPELHALFEAQEARILEEVGIKYALDEDEQQWLWGVDVMDLWLWAREELFLGNRAVQQMLEVCAEALTERWGADRLPGALWGAFVKLDNWEHSRLSDFFTEVSNELGEAGARLGE